MTDLRSIVLVVDSNAGVRGLARRILEREEYGVITAAGRHDAAALLESYGSTIAVLVTELRLVDGEGAGLASHAVRKNPALGVIYLSAGAESDTQRTAGDPSRPVFVRKPFAVEDLTRAVSSAHAGATGR